MRGDLSSAFTADRLVELARDAAEVARLTDVWFEPADLAANAKSLATPPSGGAASTADAAEGIQSTDVQIGHYSPKTVERMTEEVE